MILELYILDDSIQKALLLGKINNDITDVFDSKFLVEFYWCTIHKTLVKLESK